MRKVYSESKVENCVICNKQALLLNTQGFSVCSIHKNIIIPELKCLCGEYLMMMDGKFGKFFQCINCGNITIKRAIEINEELIHKQLSKESVNKSYTTDSIRKAVYVKEDNKPTNTIIRSDDPDYFD